MKKTTPYFIALLVMIFTLSEQARAQQQIDPVVASFTMDTNFVCQGGSIQFTNTSTGPIVSWEWTFNGSQVYNWFEENPPAIIYPFWNGGGYRVSLRVWDSEGHNNYYENHITVWPSATVDIVSNNNATICHGDSALFTASTNATNPTFHWRAYVGNLDTVVDAGQFYIKKNGSYQVTVVDDRGCVGESANVSVLVHDPIAVTWGGNFPPSNEDTIELCEVDYQNYLYLNTENVYGYSQSVFVWDDGQIGSSIAIDSTHTYIVTIDDGINACGAKTDSIYILVREKPIPEITISPAGTEFCQGDMVELSTGPEYTDIQWMYTSLSTEYTAETEIFHPEESGTYKAIVTDEFGCRGENVTPFISINPRPDKPVVVVADGCSLAASSAQVGTTYLYRWFLQNEQIENESGQYFTASTAGFYTVETTYIENGCASMSDPVYSACDPSGIENLEGTTFAPYPNPFTSQLTVPNNEFAIVTLIDMVGKIVRVESGDSNFVFDGISASAGIYQLIIDNGTNRKTMSLRSNKK